jgi:hypothetical protein
MMRVAKIWDFMLAQSGPVASNISQNGYVHEMATSINTTYGTRLRVMGRISLFQIASPWQRRGEILSNWIVHSCIGFGGMSALLGVGIVVVAEIATAYYRSNKCGQMVSGVEYSISRYLGCIIAFDLSFGLGGRHQTHYPFHWKV